MSLGRLPWLLLSLVLGALALAAGAGLVREVAAGRPLPPVRADSGARPATGPQVTEAPAPGVAPADYSVIAAHNLFVVSRGEAPAVAIPVVAANPPSTLHGVMLDGERSRAYLDDPAGGRVFGYAVGDKVAGGRLDRILEDRVVIRGPQGPIEILLHDPSKSQPEAPDPGAVPTSPRRGGPAAEATPPGADAAAAAPGPDPAAPPGPRKARR